MIRHCVPALLFLGAFTASLANAQTSDAQSVSDIRAKAQAGDPDALGILSYLITTNAVPGSKEEALNFAKTSSERGSCLGQYRLARLYDNGDGIAKDPAQATSLYQKCLPELIKKADSGNSFAQFFLGVMYAKGSGVAKDPTEAVKWYRKSAEQGNAGAQTGIGVAYADGEGVAKDPTEAAKWYRKAADQGDTNGQAMLGAMYFQGSGVAKDEVEGVKWIRKSADQGNAVSQAALGAMYFQGSGVAKDEVEGVKWFRKAADQGNAKGQAMLGVMYFQGSGVAKDEVEGVKWIRKSADQGDADSQAALGGMYVQGSSVAKDDVEGVKWYRKSAEQGNAPAQYVLGVAYANGEGVAKDPTEAAKWYRKAADQGNVDAKKALESLVAAEKSDAQVDDLSASPIEYFPDLSVILKSLPSMVRDPSLIEKLKNAKLNTKTWSVNYNDQKMYFPSMNIDEIQYLNILAGKYIRSLQTILASNFIATNAGLYTNIKTALNTLDAKTRDSFLNELNNPEAYIFSSRNDRYSVYMLASGILITYQSNTAPVIIIPHNVIMSAVSFGWTGGKIRFSEELDGATEKFIVGKNGSKFIFPTEDCFGPVPLPETFVTLVAAFNKHVALFNLCALQTSISGLKSQSDYSGEKLMGYAGLELGMPQKEALEVIRMAMDYANYEPLIQIQCLKIGDIENQRVSRAVVEYICDMQLATNGVTLIPPWSMFLVMPKDGDKIAGAHSLDVFVFVDSKLAICGRYPNRRPNNLQPSDPLEDKNDYIQLEALIKKYGSPEVALLVDKGGINEKHGFRLMWNNKNKLTGAYFKMPNAGVMLEPGSLSIADRIKSNQTLRVIDGNNRGLILPFSLAEINLKPAFNGKAPTRLFYIYYWTQEAKLILTKRLEEFLANKKEQDQNNKESGLKKQMDNL